MLFSPNPRRRRLQLQFSERRLLLMLGDIAAIVLAVLIALRIWAWVDEMPFTVSYVLPQAYWFFVLVILWLILAGANDFYELALAADRMASLQRLVVITLQIVGVYLLVFFLSPRDALPRLFIVYYGVASFGLIALWRLLNPALIGWAAAPRRVLIVGLDPSTELIIQTLRAGASNAYEIRGIISQPEDVGQVCADVPVIGDSGDLLTFINRDGIRELVITTIPDTEGEIFRPMMRAYEQGVTLSPMPLLYERLTGRVPVTHIRDHWALVLPIERMQLFDPYLWLKRIVDIGVSVIGLACFALILPLIALAMRMDSPGSIFFFQTRVGLNGRLFRVIKLRTMIPDAERYTGAVFSSKDDPRITRIGRLMRRTRLDELPQLWNVLRGDMSFIGPRPERPEHVEGFTRNIPFYRTRLVMRPGLTGWAQVRYKYGATEEDARVKLEYDLYYIRHQSLILDLNILIRTVGKVIRMSGV